MNEKVRMIKNQLTANLENSAVATGLEKVSFPSNLKERQCQRMFKLLNNYTHFTHYQQSNAQNSPSQCILQQYLNLELPDAQVGFRKGRGTRDQFANIRWIIGKAREFQKNIYFCFTDYVKAFDSMDHNKLENSSRAGNARQPDLPPEKFVCRSGSNIQYRTWNNRLVPNWERRMSRLYIVTLFI